MSEMKRTKLLIKKVKEEKLMKSEQLMTFDDDTLRLVNEFRSQNPIVLIDVPPMLFNEFLEECKWLESKTNRKPSVDEQKQILKSLLG
jgi:hypothetical protein